jgi:hypothetical protein
MPCGFGVKFAYEGAGRVMKDLAAGRYCFVCVWLSGYMFLI